MKKEEIITTLKEHYPKEIREELVRSILEQEKDITELEKKEVYKTINQIFSFVLQQAGWEITENSQSWNEMPLEIMKETFPKLNTTQWYKEQILTAKHSIDVQLKED